MTIRDLLPGILGRRQGQAPLRRSDDFALSAPLRDIDRFFDDLVGNWNLLPAAAFERFVPSIDIHETDKAIEISAEIPGMEEADIDVSITNNVLMISGEKKLEQEKREEGQYRMERAYGSFSRSLQLPEGLDINKAEAAYKNGVVSITMPKSADYAEKVKKIPISGSPVQGQDKPS